MGWKTRRRHGVLPYLAGKCLNHHFKEGFPKKTLNLGVSKLRRTGPNRK
jgi:hypothetical protein